VVENDQPSNGRNRLGQFVKGNAGGPGRPAGASIRSACARLISESSAESREKADEIATTIYNILMDDSFPARDRIRAAEFFRKSVDGDRMTVESTDPFEVQYRASDALADLEGGSETDPSLDGARNGNGSGAS
jgi:hypothetical protein